MSAPNEGRQSPEPEQQSDKQVNMPASNPNKQGQAPHEDHPADASADKLKNLEINPKHILDDKAEGKSGK